METWHSGRRRFGRIGRAGGRESGTTSGCLAHRLRDLARSVAARNLGGTFKAAPPDRPSSSCAERDLSESIDTRRSGAFHGLFDCVGCALGDDARQASRWLANSSQRWGGISAGLANCVSASLGPSRAYGARDFRSNSGFRFVSRSLWLVSLSTG